MVELVSNDPKVKGSKYPQLTNYDLPSHWLQNCKYKALWLIVQTFKLQVIKFDKICPSELCVGFTDQLNCNKFCFCTINFFLRKLKN